MDDSSLTIDDLSHAAGIPASTVRMYQNRGLLPPPERRGRLGLYGAEHLSRLRLIAHLQERGFSLAAIREVVEAWLAGRSLERLLGVRRIAPSLAPELPRVSLIGLADRFEDVDFTREDFERAIKIGLVTMDGPKAVVKASAFVEEGPGVAALGIPVSDLLDEYEELREEVSTISRRARESLQRHGLADSQDAVEELAAFVAGIVRGELEERLKTKGKPV